MEEIDLPNGKKISMKDIVRNFAYKLETDVKCIKLEQKDILTDIKKPNKSFLVLTIIPMKKVDDFITEKLTEEERRKQYKIEKSKILKEFIEKVRVMLENGEEMTLIWFADNVAYEIMPNTKGTFKVNKKDTMGEFDDNEYSIWSLENILSEIEDREDIPELIK